MTDKYYVYYHQDPRTEEIVYWGHGCYERAWVCRRGTMSRAKDHCEWFEELTNLGYTPQDWVHIHIWQLSKDKAKHLEQMRIKQDAPRFNKVMGPPKKMQPIDIERARELRASGRYYHEIADEMGLVSTMTLWRALNG